MTKAATPLNADFYREQLLTVIDMIRDGRGDEAETTTVIRSAHLKDDERLAREKEMFKRQPLVIGHSSQVQNPGDFFVHELDGRSWLIVVGDDGELRAFYNYCQHRGTKLVHDSSGCKKRFSCPYHAWTYNSKGALVGVPRADLFPGLDKSEKNLKPAAQVQSKYGLIWLQQEGEPIDVTEFLGTLVPEFEALALDDYYLFFDKIRDLKANWKLPIFAFLESYHIDVLHRDSIAEFFVSNVAYSEHHGPHIRSFVPRKVLSDLKQEDFAKVRMAEYITPTNILFPNVCMIGHPNAYTILTMLPGDQAGLSSWRHMLLIPKQPENEKEQSHFEKTIEVLDGMTYEGEDYWVSEQIQEGINAGAIDELILAKSEHQIAHFTNTVDSSLND